MDGLIEETDSCWRCWWCGDKADYVAYHDSELGVLVSDDRRLLEKLCLEGFQSGLSWLTILRKRENFRTVFGGFDFERVARYGAVNVERLLANVGIVRHRRKIESAINNAERACELVGEFGSLTAYFWQYEPDTKSWPARIDYATVMKLSKTAESVAMSKDLKWRGWS